MDLLQHIRRGRPVRGLALGFFVAALTLGALLLPALGGDALAQIPIDAGKCRKAQVDARACRSAQPGLVEGDGGELHLHEIYHAEGTIVGEIYVAREGNATRYVEHWVMYENYTYPSSITPAREQRYASEQDFLARVPFGPGSTYARWDVVEQSRIPGR